MKTILFKSILIALLVFPVALMANDGKMKGKYTKEKTLKKEYQVNSDALLKVNNKYGNVTLSSWNENRVMIEVHIKTNGNNEEKVQAKLDEITVDFEGSSSEVSARTILNKNKSSWGWSWGKNNNINMQINYTIKLPVKNSINLNNDYGGINIDRIDGHAKINCDYGRLDIGELRGRNNQLNFDYTSKSRIGYINSGEINADYSGFTIEKSGNLIIKADYTSASVGTMENLVYSCDYGGLAVSEVQNIEGNGDYIGVHLGKVHGNLAINADYGALKVDELAADAGNVSISSDYTSVKIGYHANYNFTFELSAEYAGIGGLEDANLQIKEVKNNKKFYKGYYGNQNSGNTVTIKSEYGGISLHKK